MAKNKKTTIKHLAGMVQKGFEEVNNKIDKGFEDIRNWQRLTNGRLDVIEMELIDIKKKLENVIDRREFEVLKERVQRLERILINNRRK